MKYLAFDIEILKEIPEGEDWHDLRPLGISCAATIRTGDEHGVRWYTPSDTYNRGGEKMKRKDLVYLLGYIEHQIKSGYIPLTWNGLGFDFDVLAEESGEYERCTEIALNHIDMMFHFLCLKGYPVGLNAAAKGLGLSGKTAGMKGDLAPILWQANRDRLVEMGLPDIAEELTASEMRRLVLDYVEQDVKTTLEVAEAIERNTWTLEWTAKSGKPNSIRFDDGFLTVREALKLPKPDTSWMTNPIERESLLTWTKNDAREK